MAGRGAVAAPDPKGLALRREFLRRLGLAAGATVLTGSDLILESCSRSAQPGGMSNGPQIGQLSPPENAIGVAVGASVCAVVSGLPSGRTLGVPEFTLARTVGDVPVPGRVIVRGSTASFTPLAPLAARTEYTASVFWAARNPEGHSLVLSRVWTFLTSASTAPQLGAHALAFKLNEVRQDHVGTRALSTQIEGSTLLVGVGRGNISAHTTPTDNYFNVYEKLGGPHPYLPRYPRAGTALYAATDAVGGFGHQVTVSNAIDPADELTVAAVEVRGGAAVTSVWNEPAPGEPLQSLEVVTTGPALLIAFWWGDADGTYPNTAVPDRGFRLIDCVLRQGALVQCAVAIKYAPTAGAYDVMWHSNLGQGAQLWLVAIQSAQAS